jgi:ferredoxin
VTVRIAAGCTACGACVVTCPTGALTPAPLRPAVDDVRCTDCLACLEVCPADAIVVVAAGPAPGRPRSAARMCP